MFYFFPFSFIILCLMILRGRKIIFIYIFTENWKLDTIFHLDFYINLLILFLVLKKSSLPPKSLPENQWQSSKRSFVARRTNHSPPRPRELQPALPTWSRDLWLHQSEHTLRLGELIRAHVINQLLRVANLGISSSFYSREIVLARPKGLEPLPSLMWASTSLLPD